MKISLNDNNLTNRSVNNFIVAATFQQKRLKQLLQNYFYIPNILSIVDGIFQHYDPKLTFKCCTLPEVNGMYK